jgi:hypothetical protein
MGIRLTLDIVTPLSDDDRDILAGISVMVLAIANRQDLDAQQMADDDGPRPCGALDAKGRICVSEVGYEGRHTYRPYSLGTEVPN